MTVKRLQNTHEKVQLGWHKNSKLFHKNDSKHSTALEFKKIKKKSKDYKAKHQDKFHKYENPNPSRYFDNR